MASPLTSDSTAFLLKSSPVQCGFITGFRSAFHDLDNLLAERDIDVSLQTISERAVKFGLERAPHSSRAAAIRQSKTNATSDVGACDETSGARPK
jgi:hypothetical protein